MGDLCIRFWFVILCSFEAVSFVATTFPLQNCDEGDMDLLLVTDTAMPEGCLGPKELKTFLFGITDLFLPPEKTSTRLRVGLVTSSSPGPVTIFQFRTNTNFEEIKNNINNLTICDKSNIPLSGSTVLETVDFVHNAFNEKNGSRADAIHLAIIVVSGGHIGAVDDVIAVQNKNYPANVQLFFVVISSEGAYKTVSFPNIISVADFSSLQNNQQISLALCKKCNPDWFFYEYGNPFHYSSCYFLDIAQNVSNDFFKSLSRCKNIGSSLAAIETQDELKFIEKKLFESLNKIQDKSLRWDIFIGLRRDNDNGLLKRFKWINGHPLVVSQWVQKNQETDDSQECIIWKYQVPENQVDRFLNFSQYTEKYPNGWDTINCGMYLGRLGLCEVTLGRWIGEVAFKLDFSPIRRESINKAVNRGEFIEFKEEILSIPANVENYDLYSSFIQQNNEFKLFDCKEDERIGKFISYSLVCDFIQHCSNGRDESFCLYRSCDTSLEFECLSHQCVPIESRCDLYEDCFDKSDEFDCTECRQKRCCDGNCVPKNWYNFEGICSGCVKTDKNTTTIENPQELCSIICNRTSCVSASHFGDGVHDCVGPEGPIDETIGKLERVYSCAFSGDMTAWAPRCVYVKDRYGGVLGCQDLSHLWNCKSFSCPEGYAKCPDSYCIPYKLILDGNMDCPLGEDEQYIKDYNCTGSFACWNSAICLHPDRVCDGSLDCPFRDDELNCHVTCSPGFRCIGGTVTVTNYNRNIPLQSLSFLDYRTRYLDLSGIDISSAFSRDENRQLGNIQRLVLSNCKITNLKDNFASDAWNLQSIFSLDISYNYIYIVPENSIFRYMLNLHVLNLTHNFHLAILEEKAFQAYSRKSVLESLNLSYTNISVLHFSALEDLNNLKVLDLRHTRISKLSSDSFPTMFKLRVLDIRGTSIEIFNSSSFNGLVIEEGLYTDNYGLCCPQIRGPGITSQVCYAPNDAISSCADLMGESVQRALLWLVGIIAILGNVTVIICRALWSKGIVAKAYGLFVTNLGISDFLMGVYLLTIASADLHYKGVYITNSLLWKQGVVCKLAGFLSTLSSETSAFYVFLITIDRYLVIKFPFGQYSFTRRTMYAASALAWIFGFLLAVIPSLPPFNHWAINHSNSMCLGLPLTTERLGGWEYSVAVFVGLNTIMFLVIACGQFSIYRAMSENRADKSMTYSGNRRAQDFVVAKQLSLVVLTDFLCYFPVGLMGLLAITGHEIGKTAYAWSAVLVLPINSAINPLLYTVPFLESKWEQFKKVHCKKKSQPNKTINGRAQTN